MRLCIAETVLEKMGSKHRKEAGRDGSGVSGSSTEVSSAKSICSICQTSARKRGFKWAHR